MTGLIRAIVRALPIKQILLAIRPWLEMQIKTRWLKIPVERKLALSRQLAIDLDKLEQLEQFMISIALEKLDDELR